MEVEIGKGILEALRRRVTKDGGTWYAYRNVAMDSVGLGQLQFLHCGENKTPPRQMPDTEHGIGKYRLEGFVNLDTGEIDRDIEELEATL